MTIYYSNLCKKCGKLLSFTVDSCVDSICLKCLIDGNKARGYYTEFNDKIYKLEEVEKLDQK